VLGYFFILLSAPGAMFLKRFFRQCQMIHGYGPKRRGSNVKPVTPTILISSERAWWWLIRTLRSGARGTGTIGEKNAVPENLFAPRIQRH